MLLRLSFQPEIIIMTDIDTREAPASPRLYAGIEDLPLFIDFASRSMAERAPPLRARWHPGDVVWQLNGMADRPQRNRLYFGPDGVEVAAWIVTEGELWIEATAAGERRVAEAIEAAQAWWRTRPPHRRSDTFSVTAGDQDLARIRTLETLGYTKGAVRRRVQHGPHRAAATSRGSGWLHRSR